MDRRIDALEEIWGRYIGSITPREFMAVEPDCDIEDAIKRYINSMIIDFPGIESHADEIVEYLRYYMEG